MSHIRPPTLRLHTLGSGELIVDSFAGGGGASLGIEWALGRSPDIAINHDPQAVAMHAANHASTRHYVEDVWKVDPVKACGGRPVGLAWFSPDCKHFSKAKGGKPVSKKIRGLAWIVVKWAKLVKPRVICLENVEEFQDWGPLGEDDRPDKLRKGLTFQRWRAQLENLGYKVEWRELVAADYGAPTTRKRLFLVARCDGRPIVWPEATHGKHRQPYRTAAECIDWTLACPSIFLTAEEAKPLGIKRPLAENTMRRIARGLKKFVLDNPKPFIVPYYGIKGDETRAHDVDEPLKTQTGDPKFSLITPFVAKFRGDSTGSSAEAPLPTITAGPAERPAGAAHAMALVTPFVAPVNHAGDARVHGIEEPMRTITGAHRGEHAVVAPYIARICQNGGNGDYSNSAEAPLSTIVSKNEHLVVAPYMVPRYGEDPDPRRGGGAGQAPRALPVDKPMPTIVPTQNHASLVTAFLAKHFGGHETPGSALDASMDTVTARDHHAVVASSIVKLKGTCQHGQQMDLPLGTVQAEGKHFAESRAFLMKYYRADQNPQLEAPLHTITAADRFGLVLVHGEPYQIVDIGMRMLVPRELYTAQGFPTSYRIDITYKGKPLPKDAQVRMCGNSVSPYPCAALVAAQFMDVEEAAAA